MKILLKPNQILGRIVKVVATKSGLILPSGHAQKKESIFFLVDELGSAVTDPLCKVGSVVCPTGVSNIILRGAEFHIIDEASVFCGIGELSPNELEIEGEKSANMNGNALQAAAVHQ
jgi:hypothetical protein